METVCNITMKQWKPWIMSCVHDSLGVIRSHNGNPSKATEHWKTLITSNTKTGTKTPNGVSHQRHSSNYPSGVYLLDHNLEYVNLKHVVENEELYLFIFSNAQGIPEGVWNAGSNFTPSSTAFFRNIWNVKQLNELLLKEKQNMLFYYLTLSMLLLKIFLIWKNKSFSN